MTGAIFYASKYGSTAQYAGWIGDATGLPVQDIAAGGSDLPIFDFLVIGLPVIYHKLYRSAWLLQHRETIEARPTILFTVSGAGAGAKLDGWIANSLPSDLIARLDHVALRGRQDPRELTWYDWIMLKIGGLKNPDPVARREEMKGFDFMDKASIGPVVERIKALQAGTAAPGG